MPMGAAPRVDRSRRNHVSSLRVDRWRDPPLSLPSRSGGALVWRWIPRAAASRAAPGLSRPFRDIMLAIHIRRARALAASLLVLLACTFVHGSARAQHDAWNPAMPSARHTGLFTRLFGHGHAPAASPAGA